MAIVLSAGMVLVIGQGLKTVIDEGFARGQERLLDATLATLAALIGALGVITWVRVYNVYWIGARFTADLRRRAYDHLLTLSPGFYEDARTGEVSSRVTNDVTLIEAVMGGTLLYALRMAITLAGCVAMLFFTSVKLTASRSRACRSCCCRSASSDRASGVFRARCRTAWPTSPATWTRRSTRSAPCRRSRTRIARPPPSASAWRRCSRAAIERSGYLALLIAAVIVLAFGAVGVLLWVGAHDVFAGRLTAGGLTAFIFYAVIVANAAFVLAEVYGEMQRAAGASERLLELLATQSRIVRTPRSRGACLPRAGASRSRTSPSSIRRGPRSRRSSASRITVEPGEVVALVGPSGAGKTTVFQLLLRFYDPTQGRVTLDGVDARAADPRELRHRVAVVAQDPVIFASTVLENVRYGRPEADEAQVREALQQANALDFVLRLPDGLATALGERGVKLSGGQRQRIAIARAILADRAVLLLDEATSSLDAESEKLVQQALERLMRGRTTLVIAHRLATVKSSDRIVVMDHGRVVATGAHAALAAAEGLYARLAALQFDPAIS